MVMVLTVVSFMFCMKMPSQLFPFPGSVGVKLKISDFLARPGLYTTSVPVILNGNRDAPYRILQLKGELLAPSLKFEPDGILLPSVPLNTPVSTQFNIIARGYRR